MKIVTKIYSLIHKKVKLSACKETSTCHTSFHSYDADLFTISKAYNEKLLIIYANIRV
jgi:hypothetical protein